MTGSSSSNVAAVPSILLVSGTGRYVDPWHDFGATSAAIADLLDEVGTVQVTGEVESALAGLGAPQSTVDLVVVNIGNPQDDAPSPSPEARAGLLAHLAAGRSLLAVHVASTTFTEWPEWEEILGGRWVRGTTMHPPKGDAEILMVAPDATVTSVGDFRLFDERYSFLRVADTNTILAEHDHEGSRHPLVWVREVGAARVAYDALGHDIASWQSEPHRRLFLDLTRWCLRRP